MTIRFTTLRKGTCMPGWSSVERMRFGVVYQAWLDPSHRCVAHVRWRPMDEAWFAEEPPDSRLTPPGWTPPEFEGKTRRDAVRKLMEWRTEFRKSDVCKLWLKDKALANRLRCQLYELEDRVYGDDDARS